MNERLAIDDPVVDEAVAWMVMIQDGELDDKTSVELRRWLAANSRHRAAWDGLQRSLTPFQVVDRVPGLSDHLVSAIDRKCSRRDIVRAATVLGGTATVLAVTERVYPLDNIVADASTRTGERKSVTLSDGSLIQLNARSRCNFNFGGENRGIDMLEGTALVTVHAGASPFIVQMGALAVQVAHGEAMMTRGSGLASVINVRGEVTVDFHRRFALPLKVDEGYALRGSTLVRMKSEETRGATAWTEGRLILENHTLADMIDAFRPYRSGLIFLVDAIAQRRLSGVFDLDRMDEALDMVRKLLPIQVMTIGGLVTRISPDTGGQAR